MVLKMQMEHYQLVQLREDESSNKLFIYCFRIGPTSHPMYDGDTPQKISK